MTVDLYRGVMNQGELNNIASIAATAKIIKTVFLYSTISLHRFFELKASLVRSSMRIWICDKKKDKIRKFFRKDNQKSEIDYLFLAGRTRETISFSLNRRVMKIKQTLMPNPMAKERYKLGTHIFTSQVQMQMLPKNRTRCSQ